MLTFWTFLFWLWHSQTVRLVFYFHFFRHFHLFPKFPLVNNAYIHLNVKRWFEVLKPFYELQNISDPSQMHNHPQPSCQPSCVGCEMQLETISGSEKILTSFTHSLNILTHQAWRGSFSVLEAYVWCSRCQKIQF